MLMFKETGEFDRHARMGVGYEPDTGEIIQVVISEGVAYPLRNLPEATFLQEVDDPFWINEADYLYLNAAFIYQPELVDWLQQSIDARMDVRIPVEVRRLDARHIGGLALNLSAEQKAAFGQGKPIWRKSALSSVTDRGDNAPNRSPTIHLRRALRAWVPVAELMVRRAMHIDSARAGSRFEGTTKTGRTQLATQLIRRALGYHPDSLREYRIGLAGNNIRKLELASASYQYEGSHKDAEKDHFKTLFVTPLRQVSKAIDADLGRFARSSRVFGGHFDASAVAGWAAYMLIYLRVALAASQRLDEQRDNLRSRLRDADGEPERLAIVKDCIVEWMRGVGAVRGQNENVDLPLDEVLDLQAAALIAFATNVNPFVVSPLLSHRLRNDEHPEILLTQGLFSAAQWLGDLFRKRHGLLDCECARILIEYANPDGSLEAIPSERRDEWRVAVKMLFSFITRKGLTSLMQGARAVLGDGQPRTIWTVAPAQDGKTSPKQKASKLDQLKGDDSVRLAPPIFVEMGWLILPGDYEENWREKCDPFEDEDFGD